VRLGGRFFRGGRGVLGQFVREAAGGNGYTGTSRLERSIVSNFFAEWCCMRTSLPAVVIAAHILTAIHSLSAQTVDFNKEVRPILSNRCLACHGPDEAKQEGGLRLDVEAIATGVLESGQSAIVAGKPESSELIARITSDDESVRMPPAHFGKPLSPAEIGTLKRWIEQGATFARHWSYVAPQRADVPAITGDYAAWPKNAIDNFALQKMLELKLHPSEQADSLALVRRVFLDLIGLPPTVEEVQEWSTKITAAGSSSIDDGAYAELVDHLLQRPEFGEHWARKWLDLARYADSSGYADDPARTIWPWRDWTIRAINSNMPFDQFTIEQMAGDLLPNPSEDQLIATAFHRNTMTNNEGGTQDEEFRNVAVVDRVNTTMAVWMGTTIACAQCHSHKYDPLTQDEYFQVFAILNNTEDADRGDDSPRLQLYSETQKERRLFVHSRLAELDKIMATPTDAISASQKAWDERLLVKPTWKIQKPSKVLRAGAGEAIVLDDGTIKVSTASEKDVYTIEMPLLAAAADHSITAIRLETLPSQELPGQGSGHGGGNFVITELKAQLIPKSGTAPQARFVRIDLPGEKKMLSLAEVQVFSAGENIAQAGKATQSSTDFAGPPEYANDGNTDGKFENKSVTHTAVSDNPWWEVDLTKVADVDRIVVWNRAGEGLPERLANFRITLLDADRNVVWTQNVADPPKLSAEYSPSNIRDIALAAAGADYHQAGFPPEEIFDGKTEPENGWAVGSAIAQSHALTIVPATPINVSEDSALRLIVEQNSPYPNHILGQFRLSTTTDASVLERASLPGNIAALIDKAADTRSGAEQAELASYYRESVALELAAARVERNTLRQEQEGMKPDTSVPILRELTADTRRKTLFQFRGNYLDKGHEVYEGVPAVFPPIPAEQPVNRLTFAKWLVSDENPLTARVVVNRYWENLFGRGIVATSEEFGSQGDLPTHPELLDWLSRDLIESKWNTKDLLRQIVTSATYRQSAKVTPEAVAQDLDNRWLARGPRVRLSAEMVRDQALLAAGLLSRKMYGPPVKPPQPNSGLSAAFGSSTDWQTSMGEDRYRRAIYTTWRRSNPYPSMATFDAPNREVCTLKRNRTNTPLQALVTMNDPVYVEAAQALGRLMLQQEVSTSDRIAFGFQRCVLRSPSAAELAALTSLYDETHAELASKPEQAAKLATDPLGPLPADVNAIDAATMTVVGNVLLNLDEMFLKR